MTENTTNAGAVNILSADLQELSERAGDMRVSAAHLLEKFDRLADELFGDGAGVNWDVQDVRLQLEALGEEADRLEWSAHSAQDEAADLAELVKVVEKLRTT